MSDQTRLFRDMNLALDQELDGAEVAVPTSIVEWCLMAIVLCVDISNAIDQKCRDFNVASLTNRVLRCIANIVLCADDYLIVDQKLHDIEAGFPNGPVQKRCTVTKPIRFDIHLLAQLSSDIKFSVQYGNAESHKAILVYLAHGSTLLENEFDNVSTSLLACHMENRLVTLVVFISTHPRVYEESGANCQPFRACISRELGQVYFW